MTLMDIVSERICECSAATNRRVYIHICKTIYVKLVWGCTYLHGLGCFESLVGSRGRLKHFANSMRRFNGICFNFCLGSFEALWNPNFSCHGMCGILQLTMCHFHCILLTVSSNMGWQSLPFSSSYFLYSVLIFSLLFPFCLTSFSLLALSPFILFYCPSVTLSLWLSLICLTFVFLRLAFALLHYVTVLIVVLISVFGSSPFFSIFLFFVVGAFIPWIRFIALPPPSLAFMMTSEH